jgi:hypothetical protein
MVPEAVYDGETANFTSLPDVKRAVNFTGSVHSETDMNCFRWVEDSGNSFLRYEKGLHIIPPSTFVGAHGELPGLRESSCISNTSIKAFGICKFRKKFT